jgi:hypothetical protein
MLRFGQDRLSAAIDDLQNGHPIYPTPVPKEQILFPKGFQKCLTIRGESIER